MLRQTCSYASRVLLFLWSTLKGTLELFCDWFIVGRQESPKIRCKVTHRNKFVQENCETLREHFIPAWWAINGHIETVALSMMGNRRQISKRREMITMEDEGCVGIDWIVAVDSLEFNETTCNGLLVVIPGLTSTSDNYKDLYKIAHRENFLPVVFNKRGHGGVRLTTPKLQSFGDTSDLRHCIKHIVSKYPGKALVGIGYSAGSGLLARYIGDYAHDPIFAAAALNSPAYDLTKIYGEGGLSQPYNAILTSLLKREVILPNQNELSKSKAINLETVLSSPNMRALEFNLYACMYGFEDIDEYFVHNNPFKSLEEASIPYVCINSFNDPICRKDYIPFDVFESSDYGMLVTTKRGGHCGWVTGVFKEVWADRLAVDYLKTILSYNLEKEL